MKSRSEAYKGEYLSLFSGENLKLVAFTIHRFLIMRIEITLEAKGSRVGCTSLHIALFLFHKYMWTLSSTSSRASEMP